MPINTTVIVMHIALISYYNVLFVMLYPGGIQKDQIVIIYQTINIHDFPLNFLIPLKWWLVLETNDFSTRKKKKLLPTQPDLSVYFLLTEENCFCKKSFEMPDTYGYF